MFISNHYSGTLAEALIGAAWLGLLSQRQCPTEHEYMPLPTELGGPCGTPWL